ncbi:hypothetical protein J4Q44_G00365360 [Coregonus suidteri]|uniref:TNFR-Cys domain-containing protein n=1 Tax=Coregonus suidteri TaxID=861788 RepID=A0AAN8KVQ0_9TELE
MTLGVEKQVARGSSRSTTPARGMALRRALSRPTCTQQQYLKDKRCCSKCEPGSYVFAECAGYSDTKCRQCGSDEYQPDWTNETKCLPQKFCDTGKGFNRERPSNPQAAVPCQCQPGLECSPINCEFCEKIPTCGPGYGLETDTEGRRTCVACKRGYFSPNTSIEPCRLWTNCKGLGKSDKKTGSDQTDAVCGPHLSGSSTSWVLVCVLSAITVLCLLILLLFCYKDKLKLLSVNLRLCVQNLKRTRIQQETLAPLYHSGGEGGGVGGQNCTLCEKTCLIGLAHTPSETLHTCPTAIPGDRVKLPPIKEMKEERREEEDEGMGNTTSTSTSTTSPEPSVTSVTVGDWQSKLSSEASSSEPDQGLSWRDSGGNKLLSGGAELECAPDSLQSQLAEPALTSGQVTGNNNTTFISSGQVMNFSADVIVVYVSQTSLGNEEEGPDDAFGIPVQEQTNERAPLFQSSVSSKSVSHSPPLSPGNSITHNPPQQDDNLPVQEVTDEWPSD